MQQLPLGVRLPDRAVFASFLTGRNTQARAYAGQIAEGSVSGTTWLCGPHGAGKTHLLQAICAQAGSSRAVGYVPLRELARLGVEVLDGLRQLECLCLDDLDEVVGRPDWERALFGVFREIEESGSRLVVAAQAPPALLEWALPDLGSRLSACAVFQLRVLDEAEQQAALQLRARLRGFELPDETSRWLQRRYSRDMHRLYELLDTLDEAALVAQRRLTVPFIREVLARKRL
ncbi:MAG TPA: DnaA regulatory inactivator Hda [Steroidobacteraceae bacterium]|nr:DnaA regulatory inactivator Hda [Steroidobacteraceae bacterium]